MSFNPFDDSYAAMNRKLLSACRERDQPIQAMDRFRRFDPDYLLSTHQVEKELEDRYMRLEPEVEEVARDKQRIDELIGEPLAALNAARDQICSLNRSISEANELQKQLASAPSSYERKRVHEQCESQFKTGQPSEVVRACRWKLTRATSDVKKLEQRIRSIVRRALMNVEHVVFDGNNFCYEHRRFVGLTALLSAVKAVAQRHAVTVIFDSSIRCHLKKSNGEIRDLFPKDVNVSVVPTRTKADETLLTIARNAGGLSGISCLRHNMLPRRVYASQTESPTGGTASDSRRAA